MTERIADLSLEHAAPAGRSRSRSVLFVHGMWGGSWYLRNYLYAAAQVGWDAWALNLRGHGESPAPGGLGRVGLADYVADVRRCLDHLGEAVLVGHSMGGLIAQKAAEGGGVAAAVFLTSAPPRGINALEWPVLARMARYVPAMLAGRAFTVSRAHADFLFLNGLTPEQRDWAFPRFGAESGRAARELALGGLAVDARGPVSHAGGGRRAGPHHARGAPAPDRRALPRGVPGGGRPRPHADAGGGLGAAVQGHAGVDGAGAR